MFIGTYLRPEMVIWSGFSTTVQEYVFVKINALESLSNGRCT